jgi:hypothetical protein
MRVKDNLSSITNAIGKNPKIPPKKAQIGKVYGIVTTQDTPTPEMFKKAGGFTGIGTIFYLDYTAAKNVGGNISDEFFNTCKLAKPLYPQFQYFPVLGELVYIEDLPSPVTQVSNNSFSKYYISVINLWSNNQQNSQPSPDTTTLGATFVENPNIKPLLSFEGDHIVQGRQGAALRFGSTTRLFNNLNGWSEIGTDDSPITILTNGFAYNSDQLYYVEQINKDNSSIYLTSTQKLPLQTNKTGVLNNLTNPLNASDYFNSQVVINADRVTLNSKKDEVMIFATTNVEINTKNVINLNADTRVHLNSNSIFLGPYNTNNILQPVLLGYETTNLFEHLQQTLSKLANYLSSAVGVPEGSPMLPINSAGKELIKDTQRMCDLIEKTLSQKVFTA